MNMLSWARREGARDLEKIYKTLLGGGGREIVALKCRVTYLCYGLIIPLRSITADLWPRQFYWGEDICVTWQLADYLRAIDTVARQYWLFIQWYVNMNVTMIIFWVGPDGGCGNCDIIQPPPAIITRHIISHQGYFSFFLNWKNIEASEDNQSFKPSVRSR